MDPFIRETPAWWGLLAVLVLLTVGCVAASFAALRRGRGRPALLWGAATVIALIALAAILTIQGHGDQGLSATGY